jgi:hypothetical protein
MKKPTVSGSLARTLVGHFEQGAAQGALLALAGTDDGGDREHSRSSIAAWFAAI